MKLIKCKPLILYLILNSLGFTMSLVIMLFFLKKIKKNNGIGRFILQTLPNTIFFIVTSILLYFLCSKGYTKIAWIIVSLPLIGAGILLIIGLSLGGAAIIHNKK